MTAFQLLQGAAITVVFVRGTIFSWVRTHGPGWWKDPMLGLAHCALCVGWWIGAIMEALRIGHLFGHYGALAPSSASLGAVLGIVGAGALTGCVALLFVRVLELLEAHSGDE